MGVLRRPSFETKISHERWLVSYADFITLLFAFFVVMYSVSHVNEEKYKVLSSVLDKTFSNTAGETDEVPQEEPQAQVAELSELKEAFQNSLAGLVSSGNIMVQGNEAWVEIEVNSSLLFDSGSAVPNDNAKTIFSSVASILAPYNNAVAVSGHTDNVPIRNQRYKNNWELSADRAVQVVRLLASEGVAPQRLSAVGFGEYRPIADNTTAEGRAQNRRVVLRVAKEIAEVPKRSVENAISGNADPAEQGLAVPTSSPPNNRENPESEENLPGQENLEPVRLRDGGLLFSSDPDLPRNNR